MGCEMNVAVLVLLVLLTGSSQAGGQSSSVPPILTPSALPSHAGSSASPDLAEDPGNEGTQRIHYPTGGDETSVEATTIAEARSSSEAATDTAHQTPLLTWSSAAPTGLHRDRSVTTHPADPSPSATADALSSTPPVNSTTPLQQHISTTEGQSGPPTSDPHTTFSSQLTPTLQDSSSTAGPTSTIQPPSESLTTATAQHMTTGLPLTPSPTPRHPVGPTHRAAPSELNVGDEGLKSSPLDPLLAGLLSVFIVTTAVVFIVLFLKFRQRTNHPEFHRLTDLPMDDLMEDTPLSRYTY